MKKTNSQGIDFVGALTLIFVVLKLCNLIKWSWWWVLSPLWISISFAIGAVIFIVLFIVIKQICKR